MIAVKKLGLLLVALALPILGNCFSSLVTPPDTVYLDISLCQGEEFQGQIFESPEIFTDLELGIDGDTLSVLIYSIDILEPVRTNIVTSVCGSGIAEGYSSPGIYEDVFTAYNGCDSIRTIEVKPFEAFLPNIFSPNNDGVNDYLILSTSDVSDLRIASFSVYSRSGERLISSSELDVNSSNFLWDGKANNEAVSPGTYAYYLEVTDASGKSRCPVYGDVTLIR
jgi:gliding motility-associated-like protein